MHKMNKQAFDALHEFIVQNINELVKMADRYNVERDDLVAVYATVFQNFTEVATLKSYEVKGGN